MTTATKKKTYNKYENKNTSRQQQQRRLQRHGKRTRVDETKKNAATPFTSRRRRRRITFALTLLSMHVLHSVLLTGSLLPLPSTAYTQITEDNNSTVGSISRDGQQQQLQQQQMQRQEQEQERRYIFAVMPKSKSDPFFDPVKEGCIDRASVLAHEMTHDGVVDVVCDWVGPEQLDPSGVTQVSIMNELIDMRVNGTRHYNGIAFSPINETVFDETVQRALDAGISVICFDNDAIDTARQAFVGTNNTAMGEQLGKTLLRSRPEGGQYAITPAIPGWNVAQRMQGIRRTLNGTRWMEIPNTTMYLLDDNASDSGQSSYDSLHHQIQQHPELNAIIPPLGRVMANEVKWKEFVLAHRNITTVVADASDFQMSALKKGYVDGLVGQKPYKMGECVIDILLRLQRAGNPPRNKEEDLIVGTPFDIMYEAPLQFPKLIVNSNYIGNLVILGYTLFGILALSDAAFIIWTVWNRNTRIIRASQPTFLLMLSIGGLIMGSAIIPMSIDDEYYSPQACDIACSVTPWLLSIGFCTIFSALFSKLLRIRLIQDSSQRFLRVTVKPMDVMLPFLVLLSINLLLLVCWSIISPMHYDRLNHPGLDPWNRVLSTYGACSGWEDATIFVSLLIAVNLFALIYACIQSYLARHIHTLYSESKFIAISVGILSEALVIAMPVLVLVHDQPQASYILSVILAFLVPMAVLCCIFLPKILKKGHCSAHPRGSSSPGSGSVTRMNDATGTDGTLNGNVTGRHDAAVTNGIQPTRD